MQIDGKIYASEKIANTQRKFGEQLEYYPAFLELENGTQMQLLFTKNQLDTALDRARNNPEDSVEGKTSLWSKLFG